MFLDGVIQRAEGAHAGSVEHVRVDHSGGHVGVPQKFLHRADIMVRLQQVRSEAMAERMAAHLFV